MKAIKDLVGKKVRISTLEFNIEHQTMLPTSDYVIIKAAEGTMILCNYPEAEAEGVKLSIWMNTSCSTFRFIEEL